MPLENENHEIIEADTNPARGDFLASFFKTAKMFSYVKHSPDPLRVVSHDLQLDQTKDRVIFYTTYQNDGRYAVFKFPLFFEELRDFKQQVAPSRPILDDEEQNSLLSETNTEKFNNNDHKHSLYANLVDKLLNLRHKLGITTSLLKVCGSLAYERVFDVNNKIYIGLPLIWPLFAMGFAAAYILPVYRCYKLDAENSAALTKYLDDIQKSIEEGYEEMAHNRLNTLSFTFKILLNDYYPNHADQKWQYQYLFVRIGESGFFRKSSHTTDAKRVLSMATKAEQIFLIQRTYFNYVHSVRNRSISSIAYIPGTIEYQNEHVMIEKLRQADIKKVLDIMPKESTAYQTCAKQLYKKLRDCSYLLSLGFTDNVNTKTIDWRKIENAKKVFCEIYWEPYFEIAFPATTVYYNQLHAIFKVFGFASFEHERNLTVFDRSYFFNEQLKANQALLLKINPALAQENKKYIDAFDDSYVLLNHRDIPVPEIIPDANPWTILELRTRDTYNREIQRKNERTLKRTHSSPDILSGSKQFTLDPRGPGIRELSSTTTEIPLYFTPFVDVKRDFRFRSWIMKRDRELTRSSSMPDLLVNEKGHFIGAPRIKFKG